MSKQEQIIEKKKIEIQAKLEAQKQAAALAAQAKLQNPSQVADEKGSVNIFSNDGSFMSQFKALLEKQKEKEKVESEKKDIDEVEDDDNNSDDNQRNRDYDNRKKSVDRTAKDNRYNRRNDRNRKRTQSPITPVVNEKPVGNIPSLMKIPIKPPSDHSPESEEKGWDESPPFKMSPAPGPMGSSGIGPNGSMIPSGMRLPPVGSRGMMGPPNGPMPPFMGRPPFPPNMPPFMCGPNGPMPPFFGPFPGGPMMRPPPNRHIPPFMGSYGGPNLSNAPFNPPNADSMPDSGENKNQNVPHPSVRAHVSKEDMHMRNEPTNNEVFSTDGMPPAVRRVAEDVAMRGDHWEAQVKAQHPNMWFLQNPNSTEYKTFRMLVHKLREANSRQQQLPEVKTEIKPEIKPEDKYEPEFSLEDDDSNDCNYKGNIKEENSTSYENTSTEPWCFSVKREPGSDDELETKRERRKRKKSRWGDDPPVDIKPPGVASLSIPPIPPIPTVAPVAQLDDGGVKLTTMTRNNPALLSYAMNNYGTMELNEEEWKQCENNFKLNLLYQDMLKKRQEVEKLAQAGKNKYEYDSDEDISEGTWEHRLRAKEMTATQKWATELTKQAAGKHHIGDFLPPEELKKFMEKYLTAKTGKEPDISDYKEFKLKEDNVGFKMLQKLGWSEGQGLGAEGSGIVDPINKSNQVVQNLGLGAASEELSADDDEFDAYRKRMMLAYRFRPNPLNNPRRPYY